MANKSNWAPDWVVTPGDILLEALEERDLSQAELARRMDRPVKTINEIVKGKAAVTPITAIQLERALGVDAALWMGLETKYRERLARAADRAELEADAAFMTRFPVKDLIRYGVLNASANPGEQLGQLLAFFGVSSIKGWQRSWATAPALRDSVTFSSSAEAVASWVRLGQWQADRSEVADYHAEAFRELLTMIRAWTRQAPLASVMSKVVKKCSEVGVAVVLIPEVKGTHISGAAHRTDRGTRVLQLSGRYKRDDQLWFTFFHEAGHILLTPARLIVDVNTGDDGRNADEDLVNAFARDMLIPETALVDFKTLYSQPTEADIKQFAAEIGIATGIVVGRLQRDKVIEPSTFNYLKKPVEVV